MTIDRSNEHWISGLRYAPDRIEAEKIQNGKSWIENAAEARTREWKALLDRMKPIYLWPNGAPGFDESFGQRQPAIYPYPQIREGEPRGAIIISAGGGYMFKSEWEAEPIARFFYEKGFATFIMDYRVQPYDIEISKMDAIRSVRFVRCHAAELNVLPDRIAVLGGSAGGKQSSFAATMFDDGDPTSDDPVERCSSRPDACVLSYGSFSYADALTATATPFDWEKQQCMIRNDPRSHLNPDCPPFFVWQTNADDPRYACHFCERLTEQGIPFELHIFPEGAHGCGLADGGHPNAPYCRSTSRWGTMAAEFLQNLGFLG